MPGTTRRPFTAAVITVVLLVAAAVPALAQRITTPKEQFGFNIGDDYRLATYTQLQAYWTKLDQESDRMVVQEIGRTAEGRPQLMAIITSPANHRNLARYKEISRRLSLADGVSDDEARRLAAEGKAVIWIDGGLHATEVLGAHQLMELVYQMVSRTDPETMRILDDVVLLAVHANPDGMELVSSWYMREPDTLKRNSGNIPRLYQKYIGHDNNRDFYMVNQPETENLARVLYQEWFPQIMYNHHQTGPAGVVLFAPPFRDPMNYNIDPLVQTGLDAVGAAMHGRFVAEGKGGATMRRGANYSTWWNGGLRTSSYFHNQIGLLTETIGNPTPLEVPFIPDRQIVSADLPLPVQPQLWHFRYSVDYSQTANRAVLDYASRYRETLLYNIYKMGKNSIERGGRDTWTITPRDVEAAKVALERERAGGGQDGRGRARGAPARYMSLLRDPAARDARGYILPADQPDFPTATKFVNALIKNGVTVHRATRDFEVGGKRYPAGSWVLKSAQPFRPHVIDMFEPQDHPNDFQYPGGPPIPPYDNAGYTLAYQMDVQFDRILEGFDGPFDKVQGPAKPLAGRVTSPEGAAGFLLSHRYNDAVTVTNRLLAAKHEVYWLTTSFEANGTTYAAGTIYIPARSGVNGLLQQFAADLGVSFQGVRTAPSGGALRVQPIRIGLWDRYGGSMPSGWTRWLLERFEFPFELVYAQGLDAGNLARRFDVLVFPDEAITPPSSGNAGQGSGGEGFGGQPDPQSIPAEFRGWLGRVTADKTVPQLRQFLQDGGTILTIGSSVSLAQHLGLPVENQLVDESGRSLPGTKYYIPGSVLEVAVDNSRPVAFGLTDRADVFFDNSPVLKLKTDAQGVRVVARYASATPLRSGWAWGQQYLKDGIAVAEADVGRGKLFLFGPEILFRGQPHGTFKFFFNGLYLAKATPARMPSAAGGAN